jgi:hypothetical protein
MLSVQRGYPTRAERHVVRPYLFGGRRWNKPSRPGPIRFNLAIWMWYRLSGKVTASVGSGAGERLGQRMVTHTPEAERGEIRSMLGIVAAYDLPISPDSLPQYRC